MRMASLLLVFVIAKLAVLWGRSAPVTGWAALAYVWQDALVALAFGGVEMSLARLRVSPRVTGALYWALALYAAINIPVGRAVFTPLTWPMLRAARGPLADSIREYLTLANIALVVVTLATAAALPPMLKWVPRPWWRAASTFLVAVVLTGPAAAGRVDVRGMDRNVLAALLGASPPRAGTSTPPGDWRQSPFPQDRPAEDLSRLAASARGLNVVMVGLESTAAQYLSLYGASKPGGQDVTPNLTRLAQRALVFENAYAVYPESIKGLFSILCSRFPAFDSRPEQYENAGCNSVASVLSDAGYRTALFHSGRFGYLGMESIIRRRGYQTLEDAGDIGGNHNSSFGVDEPAAIARMLAWVDGVPRGQRFFLTYLPIAGHHPYAAPERGPFTGTAEIDQYRNALHYGDASLGALIAGFQARGLAENTLWIVYGDHGEAFQQHIGNYGHTFFIYDENVRVPFFIAGPGIRELQRVRKVVSLVDTAPTILDLMGFALPATYQGRSMLDGKPRMALFFTDYSLGLLGLRDGPWKFIYETGSGRFKLFDLDRDSQELSDLSASAPDRVQRYAGIVRNWSAAQR